MTAYQRAGLLPATLESIFSQDYQFEVIVVEDGHDNHTKEVCRSFPVKYLCRQDRPNMKYSNPAIPNNIGIKHARGQVLLLQNAENVHITRDSIRRMSEPVLGDKKITTFATVWAADQSGSFQQWYIHPTHLPRPLFFCQAVDRQTVIEMRGFDEDFLYYGYDDNDFSRRLAQLGVIYKYLDDVVVKHQWHPPGEHSYEEAMVNARLYDQKASANPIRNIDREWGELKP